MAMLDSPIVVGIDGNAQTAPSVAAAVDRGAWEATRHHVDLHLVGHYAAPRPGDHADVGDAHRESAGRLLDAVRLSAAAAHPELTISTGLHRGSAGSVLVAASRTASMVIVCADARVHYGGLQAGLVSVQVAAHAQAPVIVIPAPRSRPDGAGSALVVVGIDGSQECADAVAFAFDEANSRGGGLLAVHVSNGPPAGGEVVDHLDLGEGSVVEHMLRDATAAWQHKYPAVAVAYTTVDSANPVRAISDAAIDADLIVVGARGGGGFAGLTLGSVSDGLVRFARTAVAVVRAL